MSKGELFERTEYDADEEDSLWLEKYNNSKSAKEGVSIDIFEAIMDKLEKEWSILTQSFHEKLVQQNSSHLQEDHPCNICGDNDTNNTNAIVFCDGCDLAVHQECYGVPYIPEGSWMCRRCCLSPNVLPVSFIDCRDVYFVLMKVVL